MQRHIAVILVAICVSGCTRVIAHDEAARLTAEVDEAACIADVRSMLTEVPRRLRDDYVAAQRNERRLMQVPAIAGRVIQFDSTTALDFAGPSRWVMRISRVGFNAARDSAVVTTSYGCGPVCGRFATVLLARTADGWKIVATLFMAYA